MTAMRIPVTQLVDAFGTASGGFTSVEYAQLAAKGMACRLALADSDSPYLCRISSGAFCLSRGMTCNCHWTGIDSGR